MSRLLQLLFITLLLSSPLSAQTDPMEGESVASIASAGPSIGDYNEIMVNISESLRSGDYDTARKLAGKLLAGHEKYQDSSAEEFKSFASMMGKTLHELKLKSEGRSVKVTWIPEPVADGYYFLAMIDFQDGKHAEALENIQKAIQWDPVRSAFYAERAYFMLQMQPPAESAQILASYLHALEHADDAPDFAHALRGIGYVLVNRGDIEGALACYMKSLEFDSQDLAAREQIELIRVRNPRLHAEMNGDIAVKVMSERKIPFKFDPRHVQVLLIMHDDLAQKGFKKEAAALLQRAKKMNPNDPEVKKRLK